ncbi:GNAT family N-acetyltransferase [Nocardia wallacei]|uniref:GNAT family N-acetyltransferase n=1 Tax=Nocardia wallacei TaxID=480035 RepID=UPI0024585CEF|nr:GNAT family N-acetyltransferase [Nocardia wallacei]
MSDIPVTVDRAGLWDAEALSDVAAATFPLACPPELEPTDIDTYVAQILSGERFGDYLTDPGRTVLKAMAGGDIVGYTMLVAGEPADPSLAASIARRPVLEINKLYVLPGHHGAGVGGGGGGAARRAPPPPAAKQGGGGGGRPNTTPPS